MTGFYKVNPRRTRICFCRCGSGSGLSGGTVMDNIWSRSYSSGSSCGCGSGWVNFRNGLLFGSGFGTANSLINWICGGWNRACSCVSSWWGGGFGFSPMPIGSNWNFGGCWNNSGFNGAGWGGGWQPTASNTAGSSNSTAKEDKDLAKINNLRNNLQKLQDSQSPDKEQLQKLYEEISKLKDKPLDDTNKSDNKTAYEQLLADVQKLAKDKSIELKEPEKKDNSSDAASKADDGNNNTASANDNPAKSTPPSQATTSSNASEVAAAPEQNNNDSQDTVKIGGNDTKLSDLNSVDAIKKLNPKDLDKISQNDAKKILEQLDIIDQKDKGTLDKEHTTVNILKLCAAAKVPIFVAHTEGPNVVDKTIEGIISDVKEENGKLTYNIDCTQSGTQGNKYLVTKKDDNTYNFKVTTKGKNVKLANDNIDNYDYSYSGSYLQRTGEPLTVKQKEEKQ